MIEQLYHKVVEGKKTMTRRSGSLEKVNVKPDYWRMLEINNDFVRFQFNQEKQRNPNHVIEEVCTPRYKVGEVYYLKEPFRQPAPGSQIWYKYNFVQRQRECYKWSNKLFMPASAARAFIRITGIKCERLLDISDEDCVAEGIEVGSVSFNGEVTTYINYLMHDGYGYDYIDNTPKQSFISLYKLANKLAKVGSVPPHGSLETPPGIPNIWVWAYTFEYLKDYKYGEQ